MRNDFILVAIIQGLSFKLGNRLTVSLFRFIDLIGIFAAAFVLCGCSTSTKVTVSTLPDREPAQRNISYGSYWEAMNALDFNAAVSLGHSDDEQVFARSLVDVVAGRFDSVRNVLYRLHYPNYEWHPHREMTIVLSSIWHTPHSEFR